MIFLLPHSPTCSSKDIPLKTTVKAFQNYLRCQEMKNVIKNGSCYVMHTVDVRAPESSMELLKTAGSRGLNQDILRIFADRTRNLCFENVLMVIVPAFGKPWLM